MKIGLVLDDTLDKPDGVQQHVLTLGQWLRGEGHVVHYLVANTERTDIPNIHSLGKFATVKYNQNIVRTPLPANRGDIKRLLAAEQFDVLHVQLPYSPFLAKQIIKNASQKTAVIGTFHILPASKLHGFSNRLLRLALGKSLERFDHIFAVSEPAVHFARKTYGINTSYLPNPIDVQSFRKGRRLAQYNVRKLNIVFLGRLVQRKGVLELIGAYNALPNELAAQTRLIICGKGPLKAKAKNMARAERNIIFAGYVSESSKPDYLASADIAVFPSLGGESFGIVLVEAMAAGARVVIGGNNAGYKSVLGAQPYLLFNPKDQIAFTNHLSLFITDNSLRDKMFSWQQETVGQYDISVVGPHLITAYNNALQQRK
ncbi:glycosyltransferase family 4 protein [Candidatus Saccharibacteria bacterium]|nr:glycosyltransferase family 4 protein [Candidatus Saccharibacteria bacterium]